MTPRGTMVRSEVCNSGCFCLGSYIQHQHQHFMIFDISLHLVFHVIEHFMSLNISCHLTFHVIWHFMTFDISSWSGQSKGIITYRAPSTPNNCMFSGIGTWWLPDLCSCLFLEQQDSSFVYLSKDWLPSVTKELRQVTQNHLETFHDIHGFSCLGTVKKGIKNAFFSLFTMK